MQLGQRRGSSWQLPSGSSFIVFILGGKAIGSSCLAPLLDKRLLRMGLEAWELTKPRQLTLRVWPCSIPLSHILQNCNQVKHMTSLGDIELKAVAGPQGSCYLLASILVSGMPKEATFSRVRICGFFCAAHFRTASRARRACSGGRPQAHQAQKHHRPSEAGLCSNGAWLQGSSDAGTPAHQHYCHEPTGAQAALQQVPQGPVLSCQSAVGRGRQLGSEAAAATGGAGKGPRGSECGRSDGIISVTCRNCR